MTKPRKPSRQAKAEGGILRALRRAKNALGVKLTDEDKWRTIEVLRDKQREQRKKR